MGVEFVEHVLGAGEASLGLVVEVAGQVALDAGRTGEEGVVGGALALLFV